MSRTTLSILTAAGLAAASLALLITRQQVLGNQVNVPVGPGTWRVTLLVTGKSTGETRLMTLTPLDFGRQHILKESCRSEELLDRPPDARHPNRRQVIWTRRAGVDDGPFRAYYEFFCAVNSPRPTAPMTELTHSAYATPQSGQFLQRQPTVEIDHPAIAALARRLTTGRDRVEDQVEALFRYVDLEIVNDPSVAGPAASAAECLSKGSGDSAAKSPAADRPVSQPGCASPLGDGIAVDARQQAGRPFLGRSLGTRSVAAYVSLFASFRLGAADLSRARFRRPSHCPRPQRPKSELCLPGRTRQLRRC